MKANIRIYAAAAMLTAAIPAIASEPASSAEKTGDSTRFVTQLRDVEVVGVKRNIDENMQLISVIPQAQITRLDITGIRGISDIVPNFYIPKYGSRMTSSIYVRGLGSRIDQPAVGLNVDNVPYLNKDSYDLSLADIDRIEVVRGSAGVLNGRNALAGQINVYTMSPWSYRGWRMCADFGRANTADVSVSWYGRITPTLATSVSAMIGTTDGFYKNAYYKDVVNDGVEEDKYKDVCGQERQASGRWKLSWHPDTRWSLSNTAALSWSHQEGYPYQSLESGLISYNDSTYYQRLKFEDGLTVSYTGRRIIATSVTSVQYMDDNMTLDQDFLPQDYFTLSQKRHEWVVTQDLFTKGLRGSYTWLTGLFGFYRKTDMDAPVTFKNTGIRELIENNVNRVLPKGMELRWDSRQMTLGSDFDIHNSGFALYHESTVRFGDFTAQGGLRWDIEHVGLDYTERCFTSCTMGRVLPDDKWMPLAQRPIDIDDNGSLSQTFNQLLPQISLAYEPRPWLNIRASVSKGYKAGGYNTQMFSNVLQQKIMKSVGMEVEYDVESLVKYKPEKAWTYEVTAGFGAPTGRAHADVTLFMINCRDQQLTIFPEGSGTGRAMANADRTRSFGVELSGRWRPTDALKFNASYGYTNATFRSYNYSGQSMRGKFLPYAPRHTFFAEGTYLLPWTFAGISAEVGANTHAAGKIFWDDMNTIRQKFYATLGASVTLHHDVAELVLWGQNLTNTRYNTFYFKSIGHAFVQRADPWTIGATLRINLSRDLR